MPKHLGLKFFYSLLAPFSQRSRHRRMELFRLFLEANGLQNPRILDLGGDPRIWQTIPQPLDITILNLPGAIYEELNTHHRFTYVEGDGCNVSQFGDGAFDVVFSNSVIEHVGDAAHQQAFAREVQRLGHHYWLQTPSKFYPIEAHCGMPGWWFYPQRLRQALIERWHSKLPAWTDMVAGTTVLTKQELRQLFPQGQFKTEWSLGFPKSYIVHSPVPPQR